MTGANQAGDPHRNRGRHTSITGLNPQEFFKAEMGILPGCLDFRAGGRNRILTRGEQEALIEYPPDSVCWLCGARFDRHFLDIDYLNEELRPFLRTLCDGTVVKLSRQK